MDIKYSIIAPAIRSDLYGKFYENISFNNHTSYEIIFVGHVPPKEKMPDNFKYIYTEVRNIPQCAEIGSRSARGEYVLFTGDDISVSNGFMDRFDYYSKRLDMNRVVLGSRMMANGKFCDQDLVLFRYMDNSPVLGMITLFKKDMWKKLGGIDRRFAGSFYITDVLYRFYEKGYSIFIIPDAWSDETKYQNDRGDLIEKDLFLKTGGQGRDLMRKLWYKNGQFTNKRSSEVHSFFDSEILTKDQFEKTPNDYFKNEEEDITEETDYISNFCSDWDIPRDLLPNVKFGMGMHGNDVSNPCIEISGGEYKNYVVDFIDEDLDSLIYSCSLSPNNYAVCIPQKPFDINLLIRILSHDYGYFYKKRMHIRG